MPRSAWFKALLLFVAFGHPQAETGWQPIQETIHVKVIKITASIRLYVWITV